jgi:hypothetical protein
MHLVTGMIIAALAGRNKKNASLAGIPFHNTGPLRVVHSLPGRIRLVAQRLKDEEADQIKGVAELEKIDGIDEVRLSAVTGSVLIRYDERKFDPLLLYGAVARLLGLDAELEKPVRPLLLTEMNEIGSSLNRTIYDETYGLVDLRTLLIAAFVVLGGRQLLRERWGALPAGVTLLWWAFNLSRDRQGSLE